jgi:hypothetical protein
MYLARGAGYTLFLTRSGAIFSLCSDSSNPPACDSFRLRLVGADEAAHIEALEPRAGRSNYLIGSDPSGWLTDILHYGRVRYEDVYPGIDLVFYGRGRWHEYDFEVAPGVDPSVIRLELIGHGGVSIDDEGNLIVATSVGNLVQQAPVVYQDFTGRRREANAEYEILDSGSFGFAIAGYDVSRPLVIDPMLVYSTFLGGSASDIGYSVAVDEKGNAYVAGETVSTDFATGMSFQGSLLGSADAFVTKFTPAGDLSFSTYLGGGGADEAREVVVDSAGSIYLTGQTNSTDFPTVNALQGTFGGGTDDAFVAKLSSTGTALVYSTYLGGSNYDLGEGLAVDGGGRAYVVGDTLSSDFPTWTPLQGAYAGNKDAFITKLPSTGAALFYSTYVGGLGLEEARSVAVDGSGNAYVTGKTGSLGFPTRNAAQPTRTGSDEAYLLKINYAGSQLDYSTYIGGTEDDLGSSISVDSTGNAYVGGQTSSTDFPTLDSLQPAYAGGFSDGFVSKYASDGAVVFATYLGGSEADFVRGIAASADGDTFLLGGTQSPDFPTLDALQGSFAGNNDLIVASLDQSGKRLVYSPYLGGTGGDSARDLAIGGDDDVFITGSTLSGASFPTVAAFQTHGNGMTDLFLAKLSTPLDFFIASTDFPLRVRRAPRSSS